VPILVGTLHFTSKQNGDHNNDTDSRPNTLVLVTTTAAVLPTIKGIHTLQNMIRRVAEFILFNAFLFHSSLFLFHSVSEVSTAATTKSTIFGV
jgi:hypothetical protein